MILYLCSLSEVRAGDGRTHSTGKKKPEKARLGFLHLLHPILGQEKESGLSSLVSGPAVSGFEPTRLVKSKQDLNSLVKFIRVHTYFFV